MSKSFWWTLIAIIVVYAAMPVVIGFVYSAETGYWFLMGQVFVATLIFVIALLVAKEDEERVID